MNAVNIPKQIQDHLEQGERVLWTASVNRRRAVLLPLLAVPILSGLVFLVIAPDGSVLPFALPALVVPTLVILPALVWALPPVHYAITNKRILTASRRGFAAADIKPTSKCGGAVWFGFHWLTFDNETGQVFFPIPDYREAKAAFDQVVKSLT